MMASALEPEIRRWWSLLDQAPQSLTGVERWTAGPAAFLDAHPGCIEEFHPTPTLELCLTGALRIEKPNQRCDLNPGQGLIIPPVVWHRVAPIRAGSLRFSIGFIPQGTLVLFHSAERQWSGLASIQPCRRLMNATLAPLPGEARRQAVARLLRALLAESVELFDYPPALWQMVRLIWTRARLGLTVEEMLAASGLSRTHAYRLFTRGYGAPPKAAITAYRLQLVEGLLASGLGVGEAARRAGFPHPDALRRAKRRPAIWGLPANSRLE